MNINRKRIICGILVTVLLSLLLSACRVNNRPNQENPGSPIDDIRQQGRENPLPKVDSTSRPKDNKNGNNSGEEAKKPKLPEALGAEEGKEPSMKVYITEESQVKGLIREDDE